MNGEAAIPMTHSLAQPLLELLHTEYGLTGLLTIIIWWRTGCEGNTVLCDVILRQATHSLLVHNQYDINTNDHRTSRASCFVSGRSRFKFKPKDCFL
jgi:hypothetical protein